MVCPWKSRIRNGAVGSRLSAVVGQREVSGVAGDVLCVHTVDLISGGIAIL